MIIGECPRCRMITKHKLISEGAKLYRCHVCDCTHGSEDIRIPEKPEVKQKELSRDWGLP